MDSFAKDLQQALPRNTSTRQPPRPPLLNQYAAFRHQLPPPHTNAERKFRPRNANRQMPDTASRFVTDGESRMKQRLQMTASPRRPDIPLMNNNRAIPTARSSNTRRTYPGLDRRLKTRVPTYNNANRSQIWKMLREQVFGHEVELFSHDTKGWEKGGSEAALRAWLRSLKKRRKKMKRQGVNWASDRIEEQGERTRELDSRSMGTGPQQQKDLGKDTPAQEVAVYALEECVEMTDGLSVAVRRDYVEMMKELKVT